MTGQVLAPMRSTESARTLKGKAGQIRLPLVIADYDFRAFGGENLDSATPLGIIRYDEIFDRSSPISAT